MVYFCYLLSFTFVVHFDIGFVGVVRLCCCGLHICDFFVLAGVCLCCGCGLVVGLCMIVVVGSCWVFGLVGCGWVVLGVLFVFLVCCRVVLVCCGLAVLCVLLACCVCECCCCGWVVIACCFGFARVGAFARQIGVG